MTKENKILLIKDLCARLPYGVQVQDTRCGINGKLHDMLVFPLYKGNDVHDYIATTNFYTDCYYDDICFNYVFFKDQDKWKLIPNKFDISTLVPFESRVLVRDVDHNEWEGAIFGRYDGNAFFTIGGLDWRYCIPYEGNEHLLGKTIDCDGFYKNW